MYNDEPYNSPLSPHSSDNTFAPYQMDIAGMVKRSLQEEPSYKPLSLLQRLFPSQFEKIARENQIRELSERYEFRRQILNTIGNMICEDLKQQCFHHLQRSRIKLEGETKTFLMQQVAAISLKSNQITIEYLRALEQQLHCLETFGDIESKRLAEHQMQRQRHLVFQRLQELMEEFINSTRQGQSYWS